MDLFEKFRREVGKIPWGAVASVLSEEVHVRTGAVGDAFGVLGEWARLLTQNALIAWTPIVAKGETCASPDVSKSAPRPCRNFAVTECDVCGRPCCLAHCRVDYFAGAICEPCIGEAKARARQDKRQYTPPKETDAEIRAALKTLGLKRSASWEEIRAAYKKLAFEHNADRPQSTRERARNEARLKKINLAYQVLRKHFEGSKEAA